MSRSPPPLMNFKRTWIWVLIAACLFAFIFFFERHAKKKDGTPSKVFPGLNAKEIHQIQAMPRGQLAIRAERTNGTWRLTQPIHYPALSARIDALLSALEQLSPAPYLPQEDVKTTGDEQFGFDSPLVSLMIGQRLYHVQIGNRTVPGDQVFLQVVGTEGIHVVTAELLRLIPQSANDWRETALLDPAKIHFDQLTVTNAGKTLSLQRNLTNKLWRMILPMETRADSDKVEEALRQLQDLRAQEFVSDEPKPDLDAYGLQTPELSLAFYDGTNRVFLVDLGKSLTNGLTYARRNNENTVVTVPKTSFASWLFSESHEFRDFLDHQLVTLTSLPDEIEIQGQENFTLKRQTNGSWRILPHDFPADPVVMKDFLANFTNFHATEIVRNIAPEADLQRLYGLAPPKYQYTVKTMDLDSENPTNRVIAQLQFGVQDGKVYARRAGEDFVYAINPADLERLPSASLKMRDRRIWNFVEDDVARIFIRQQGRTRELIRKGTLQWALGSQGILSNELALDEIVHRLGELTAAEWVQCGDQNWNDFGFKQVDYQLTIELKNGEKLSVDFGKEAASQFPYASVILDGKTWIFEFPLIIYHYTQLFLTIPPGTP
jgi:hypothetical protein